jgi:hypothetical protein
MLSTMSVSMRAAKIRRYLIGFVVFTYSGIMLLLTNILNKKKATILQLESS